MRDRPKVGEILVQAGIIDELQLASALGEQTRWGRRLGMTLIKLGMVQEGHLVRALAKQFDLPVASLAGKKIAPEVLALVPARVASEHSVVPLFVKKEGHREQLFLGMEEPSDLGILDDLAFRTGMLIRPVMVGPTEIGEAIDRYYNTKPTPAPSTTLPDPMRGADTLSETNLRSIQEEAPPSLSQLLKPSPAPAPVVMPVQSVAARPAARRAIDATPVVFDAPPAMVELPVATAPAPTEALASRVSATPPPISMPTPMLTPMPSATATAASAPTPVTTAGISEAAPSLGATRDAHAIELARAVEETERTRLVAKAIAHLLIEKGLLTLDELQARIEKMKTMRPGSPM